MTHYLEFASKYPRGAGQRVGWGTDETKLPYFETGDGYMEFH